MIVVGIDPGIKGALFSVDDAGNFEPWFMPTRRNNRLKRDEYDIPRIVGILGSLAYRADKSGQKLVVGCEKLGAMPHGPMGGAIANFSRGLSHGFEWACTALRIEYHGIWPQTWQAVMLDARDRGANVDEAPDTKARALAAVRHIAPEIDLREGDRAMKAHDGLCDAILIALYTRKLVRGELLEPKIQKGTQP